MNLTWLPIGELLLPVPIGLSDGAKEEIISLVATRGGILSLSHQQMITNIVAADLHQRTFQLTHGRQQPRMSNHYEWPDGIFPSIPYYLVPRRRALFWQGLSDTVPHVLSLGQQRIIPWKNLMVGTPNCKSNNESKMRLNVQSISKEGSSATAATPQNGKRGEAEKALPATVVTPDEHKNESKKSRETLLAAERPGVLNPQEQEEDRVTMTAGQVQLNDDTENNPPQTSTSQMVSKRINRRGRRRGKSLPTQRSLDYKRLFCSFHILKEELQARDTTHLVNFLEQDESAVTARYECLRRSPETLMSVENWRYMIEYTQRREQELQHEARKLRSYLESREPADGQRLCMEYVVFRRPKNGVWKFRTLFQSIEERRETTFEEKFVQYVRAFMSKHSRQKPGQTFDLDIFNDGLSYRVTQPVFVPLLDILDLAIQRLRTYHQPSVFQQVQQYMSTVALHADHGIEKDIMNRLHHLFGTRGTHLASTGASTYAEMTRACMDKTCDMLLKHKVIQEHSDIAVDLGSGAGTFLQHLCLRFRCRGIGVEYDPCRQRLTASLQKEFLRWCSETWPEFFRTEVYLGWENFLNLKELPTGVKLGYVYDQAFSPIESHHCAYLFWTCKVPFVLSVKETCHGHKGFWGYYGYERVDCVSVRKAKGSGSSNTFVLYRRVEGRPIDPKFTMVDIEKRLATYDPIPYQAPLQERAEKFFYASTTERIEICNDMIQLIDESNGPSRKRRKIVSNTRRHECRASMMRKCPSGSCPTCSVKFKHHESSVGQDVNNDSQNGIFARSSIEKGFMILRIHGSWVHGPCNDKWSLRIGEERHFKVSASSLVRHIRIAESTNATIQKWTDPSGREFLSLLAKRSISAGEEVTCSWAEYGQAELQRPNVLALLMARTDEDVFERIGRTNKFSQQLRRDTARCLTTEKCCGVNMYTVDHRQAGKKYFSHKYHTEQDINKTIRHPRKYREIFMDWVWWRQAHSRARINKGFYTTTLPALVGLLESNGCVYLPLCPTVLLSVVAALESHDQIDWDFVAKEEMESSSLFLGTSHVQKDASLFGKVPDQHLNLGFSTSGFKQECSIAGQVFKDMINLVKKKMWKGYEKALFLKVFPKAAVG